MISSTPTALVLRCILTGRVVRPATEQDMIELLLSVHGAVWAGGTWCYVGTDDGDERKN